MLRQFNLGPEDFTIIKRKFGSWLVDLKNLHPSNLPPSWLQIGDTPFTTMGVIKNYCVKSHLDKEDANTSFILNLVPNR